jgi:DNA-binding CsgD family transcriptional regulator
MIVIGRDPELARLEQLLDEPAPLVLVGEAGIGKTTVWEAGVAAAAGRGFRVLRIQPAEAEASLAFAGLADLLAGVEDSVYDELPRPQRDALDFALLRQDPTGPSDPRAVFAGLRSVLETLAARTPVLLAVDDHQWLDAPTARAVEFAARRLRDAPVAFLVAARYGGPATAEPPAGWPRLRVGPLTAGALHQLVRQRLGLNLTRPALLQLHDACRGNPFVALELARALDPSVRVTTGVWPVTADGQELVDAHLAALPASAREALVVLAASSQPSSRLIDPEDLLAAERAGLVRVEGVGRIRFAHPLYASTVYHGAAPEVRRAVHARLAEDAESQEERVRHLGLATEHADERVADELELAADRAAARGAPEIAAGLAERAAELTPESRAAAPRVLKAAGFYLAGGAPSDATRLLVPLLAKADEHIRPLALHLLALARFREEDYPETVRLLHETAAEPAASPELLAAVQLHLAFTGLASGLDHRPAQVHANLAVEHAELGHDPRLVAATYAVKTLIDFLVGDGLDEERLALALELEDDDPRIPLEARPSMVAGFLAFYVGQIERARALLYPLRSAMRENGAEAELPLLSIHIAWLECVAGDTAKARAFCDEALELADLGHSMPTHAQAFAAFLDAYTGDAGRCRTRIAAALAASRGECLVLEWVAMASGLLELALENYAAADEALEPLTRFFEEYEIVDPVHLFFMPDKIEALVALGEIERAASLTDLLTRSAAHFERAGARAAAHRCTAILAAAAGDLETAATALDSALSDDEHAAKPLEHARTLIVLGQVERRRKRKASARRALERAATICDAAGAPLWAQRARDELARVGSRPVADELTPTEARVAELVASGLTNREVAAAAFMSLKTVEANLTRIYRKLGIRSRAQLGTTLAQSVNARWSAALHPAAAQSASTNRQR